MVTSTMKGLHNDGQVKDATLERVPKELDEALSTVGFVYLKNHGIDQHLVSRSTLLKLVVS